MLCNTFIPKLRTLGQMLLYDRSAILRVIKEGECSIYCVGGGVHIFHFESVIYAGGDDGDCGELELLAVITEKLVKGQQRYVQSTWPDS